MRERERHERGESKREEFGSTTNLAILFCSLSGRFEMHTDNFYNHFCFVV